MYLTELDFVLKIIVVINFKNIGMSNLAKNNSVLETFRVSKRDGKTSAMMVYMFIVPLGLTDSHTMCSILVYILHDLYNVHIVTLHNIER